MAKTLFDKIWEAHVVQQLPNGPTQLYIDRHFIHEVPSPQAFAGLERRGVKVFRPEQTFATCDHNTPTQNQELPIDRGSEGFRLITRIQDEAHRFAIEYHRSLRTKEQVHSILDDIEGIGPARRKALMKAFQSLDEMKAADVEVLAEVPSMNRAAAEKVYEFFHKIKDI
mgnify:CR=1 FL=1